MYLVCLSNVCRSSSYVALVYVGRWVVCRLHTDLIIRHELIGSASLPQCAQVAYTSFADCSPCCEGRYPRPRLLAEYLIIIMREHGRALGQLFKTSVVLIEICFFSHCSLTSLQVTTDHRILGDACIWKLKEKKRQGPLGVVTGHARSGQLVRNRLPFSGSHSLCGSNSLLREPDKKTEVQRIHCPISNTACEPRHVSITPKKVFPITMVEFRSSVCEQEGEKKAPNPHRVIGIARHANGSLGPRELGKCVGRLAQAQLTQQRETSPRLRFPPTPRAAYEFRPSTIEKHREARRGGVGWIVLSLLQIEFLEGAALRGWETRRCQKWKPGFTVQGDSCMRVPHEGIISKTILQFHIPQESW
jgi:hypothetical protein